MVCSEHFPLYNKYSLNNILSKCKCNCKLHSRYINRIKFKKKIKTSLPSSVSNNFIRTSYKITLVITPE